MREANFNFIAPYYDYLARVIFRDRLMKAKCSLLPILKERQKVLILGGGTGELLEQINRLNTPFEITFLESSKKMISIAKKRRLGSQVSVEFIESSIFDFKDVDVFDVVITNFFLDVFTTTDLKKVIELIILSLKEKGKWIVTDFQKEKIGAKHRFILWVMHFFFKVTSRLPSNNILPFDDFIRPKGLRLEKEYLFMQSFVFSRLYVK